MGFSSLDEVVLRTLYPQGSWITTIPILSACKSSQEPVPHSCCCTCRNLYEDDREVEDRTSWKPGVLFMAGPFEGAKVQ